MIGRDGKDLGKWWRSTRFQAYQGIAVPGFPNFLSLASPYSYSGFSFFTTIEGQMKHIDRLRLQLRQDPITATPVAAGRGRADVLMWAHPDAQRSVPSGIRAYS